MSDRIDVWCDGSWRSAQNIGGAGWVIKRGDNITRGSTIIPKLGKSFAPHGSDIAEMTAVVQALRGLPRASEVLLRMDCQSTVDWLKAGKITGRNKMSITPLQVLFTEAMGLIASRQTIDIIKISGPNNHFHNEAHRLSRAACHKHS